MRWNESDESDESYQKEVEGFFDEKDEEQKYIEMMQAGLDIKYSNQKNISLALQILEKDFFWRFYSNKRKVKEIKKMFNFLSDLIN